MSLVFCRDAEIRALNRQYRGRDEPTDVLSFSQSGGPEFPAGAPSLGDVVISVETARRQAAAAGHSLAQEAEWLLLHGTLHLLGYDHPTDADARRMDSLSCRARSLADRDASPS